MPPPILMRGTVLSGWFFHKYFSFYHIRTACCYQVHKYHLSDVPSNHNMIGPNIRPTFPLKLRSRCSLSNQTKVWLRAAQYYALQYAYHISGSP